MKPTILSMNTPLNIGATSGRVGGEHGEQRADGSEQDDAEAAVSDEHQEHERKNHD